MTKRNPSTTNKKCLKHTQKKMVNKNKNTEKINESKEKPL